MEEDKEKAPSPLRSLSYSRNLDNLIDRLKVHIGKPAGGGEGGGEGDGDGGQEHDDKENVLPDEGGHVHGHGHGRAEKALKPRKNLVWRSWEDKEDEDDVDVVGP